MTGTDVAVADDQPTGQQVSVATMGDEEISRLFRVARALAASGMFKDAHQAEEAFAKIMVGRDLGLTPTQAMMGLHIVEGKPEVGANLLAGFVQRHPTYSYKRLEHTDEKCTLEFFDGEESLGKSEFTIEDAQKAGLIKDKSAWPKYPRNMLFARAMSNGVKWCVPELTGGIPVYVDNEIERVENLADGEGAGTPPGMQLPPEVEAVMRRARDLGHRGLADRATVEMTLMGQPPERVAAWVTNATTDLDRLVVQADDAPAQGPDNEPDDTPRTESASDQFDIAARAHELGIDDDAEEVDGEVVQQAVVAKGLLDRALAKQDEADAARADGREDDATALEEEAEGLRSEAQALADPRQSDLGL